MFAFFVRLSNSDLWNIGINHVAKQRGQALKARADFSSKDVKDNTELGIVSSPYSHHMHANIVDWPEEKDKQMLMALEIVNRSSLEFP